MKYAIYRKITPVSLQPKHNITDMYKNIHYIICILWHTVPSMQPMCHMPCWLLFLLVNTHENDKWLVLSFIAVIGDSSHVIQFMYTAVSFMYFTASHTIYSTMDMVEWAMLNI